MKYDLSLLPPSLRELVSIIGIYAVSELVREFGGMRLVVSEESLAILSNVIGANQAKKLLTYVLGDRVSAQIAIPKCHRVLLHIRNAEITERIDAGEDMNVLVAEYKLSWRQLYNIARSADALPIEPKQLQQLSLLFED